MIRAKEDRMLDKARVEIVPPLAGSDLVAEQERLLKRRLAGRATDEDLARLEALPGEIAAAIEAARIVLVFQTATRRGGFRRGDLLRQAREWLEAQGYGEGTAWGDIPADVREEVVVLQQAATIAGALVPEECRNFAVPEDPAGWLDLPDYIYAATLGAAWRLNPHWLPVPVDDEDDESKN
jgi:hypothetical protein